MFKTMSDVVGTAIGSSKLSDIVPRPSFNQKASFHDIFITLVTFSIKKE